MSAGESIAQRPEWNDSRAEVLADGAVHAMGVLLGPAAVAILIVLTARTAGPGQFASVLVYGISLVAVLVTSALYNLWPVSRAKWILRRFDHSAIYLLIAGTYSPFIAQMKGATSTALLIGVWTASLTGVALKLLFPGRFDRVSIWLYLLIGWSGVLAYETIAGLPDATLRLLALGGLLYTIGVVFHLWRSLPFQNAIWHMFVLTAAACHYGAVLDFTLRASR
jgi:hemolysin III